jgi:hypothetical protein
MEPRALSCGGVASDPPRPDAEPSVALDEKSLHVAEIPNPTGLGDLPMTVLVSW